VPYRDLMHTTAGESSVAIRERVVAARGVQQGRFRDLDEVRCNAQMPAAVVQRLCKLSAECQVLLERAVKRLGFSARAIERIIKVGRTIADLSEEADILPHHVAEAIQYRNLDRATIH
jgi:magnesium chelatase family protein